LIIPGEQPPPERCSEVLSRLCQVAKDLANPPDGDRIDPVMEFDKVSHPESPTLHILDPFFAYRLRWGLPAESLPPRYPSAEDRAFEDLAARLERDERKRQT
jgi:hypothetical protein